MPYVVIDRNQVGGDAAVHDESEWPVEVFTTQNDAVDRAKELAARYPPNPFDIAQIVLRVQCPVGKPDIKPMT